MAVAGGLGRNGIEVAGKESVLMALPFVLVCCSNNKCLCFLIVGFFLLSSLA